ncbi:multidrug efflux transporter transcriptional repressor AcrR [Candidatus Sodalis endolongispinus]|uniref:Multidrug efflux transporter transcriptional repressor AcrR n=1 Tax=Candidatus Sodalis endolongispinus TaxID=2812662 RepID=A0ABS5YCW1_9GAMM|nr:multidrug efflux transporter transcriptional repressor AcrR [Candidatus Sodalis endolongispinus]MBT9432542.1 multidrug efflux transporter transcriptional repressor AcrR [Candidatus Sodalis endolongispinus]
MARKTKRQAQETRQHILDAAIKAFLERGVSATSLNDIAALAGVTRGAIYWHFKNKAELFNEILHTADSKIQVFETEYQTKYPDNPLYVLTETMIYILDATVSNRQWRELMEILFHKCEFVGEMALYQEVRSQLFDECYDRLEVTLGRCIEQQQLPATLHCRRAAIMSRAYMTGLMENWLFTPESFDLQSESRTLVFGLIDMLRMSPMLRCGQHDAPRSA